MSTEKELLKELKETKLFDAYGSSLLFSVYNLLRLSNKMLRTVREDDNTMIALNLEFSVTKNALQPLTETTMIKFTDPLSQFLALVLKTLVAEKEFDALLTLFVRNREFFLLLLRNCIHWKNEDRTGPFLSPALLEVIVHHPINTNCYGEMVLMGLEHNTNDPRDVILNSMCFYLKSNSKLPRDSFPASCKPTHILQAVKKTKDSESEVIHPIAFHFLKTVIGVEMKSSRFVDTVTEELFERNLEILLPSIITLPEDFSKDVTYIPPGSESGSKVESTEETFINLMALLFYRSHEHRSQFNHRWNHNNTDYMNTISSYFCNRLLDENALPQENIRIALLNFFLFFIPCMPNEMKFVSTVLKFGESRIADDKEHASRFSLLHMVNWLTRCPGDALGEGTRKRASALNTLQVDKNNKQKNPRVE